MDILHTELRLSFDWQKQEVWGTAVLTLRPNINGIKEFYLDAKSMEILNVSIKQLERLNWEYNYKNDRIHLKKDNSFK